MGVLVTWREKRFVCDCRRNEASIPRAAGFLWDAKRQEWWSREPEVAEKMKTNWDKKVEQVFAIIRKRREEIDRSRATDADIQIPAPAGQRYLGYQKAGIAYCRSHRNVLLADDMGLGKTIQGIGVINDAAGAIRRVLIVCPASLKLNWLAELRKWLVDDSLRVGVAEGSYWPRQADIVIMNYDIAERHRDAVRAAEWDLFIADECHYLKNPKARRTKAVLGGQIKAEGKTLRITPTPAKRALFLTGTPICNRPVELWPLIHYLDRERWNDWRVYTRRYCNATFSAFGEDSSGASNLDELQRALRATIMIRRMKSEVLTELPPKIRQIIEIPATAELRQIIEAERRAMAKHNPNIEAMQEAVASARINRNETEYREAMRRLNQSFSVGFEEMSAVRKAVAIAKIPFVLAHLRECAQQVPKIVVFAHHEEVLLRLSEAFPTESVLLYGKTPMPRRQENVLRFQQDRKIQFFFGGIIPAGVGHTLTASSHVVFAELDWVPGNMRQAADRCHRIGQRDSVLCQYMVLAGSLDAYMARTIIQKEEVIEQALDWTAEDAPETPCATKPIQNATERPIVAPVRFQPVQPRVLAGEQRELF